MTRKKWTEEEIAYLEKTVGRHSRKFIAKKLNRSQQSVDSKIRYLRLNAINNTESITIADLSKALIVHRSTIQHWIDNMDLKTHRVGKYVKVTPQNWWAWAEKNKKRINWNNVDPYSFGIEPDWVDELRGNTKRHYSHSKQWSKQEDARLIYLVRTYKYTYQDISLELDRSEAAVKRRLYDLGIKERPVPKDKKKYSKAEIKIVLQMKKQGRSVQEIAEAINGSAHYITDRIAVWEKELSV